MVPVGKTGSGTFSSRISGFEESTSSLRLNKPAERRSPALDLPGGLPASRRLEGDDCWVSKGSIAVTPSALL